MCLCSEVGLIDIITIEDSESDEDENSTSATQSELANLIQIEQLCERATATPGDNRYYEYYSKHFI